MDVAGSQLAGRRSWNRPCFGPANEAGGYGTVGRHISDRLIEVEVNEDTVVLWSRLSAAKSGGV